MKAIICRISKKSVSIVVLVLFVLIFASTVTTQGEEVGTATPLLSGSNEIPSDVRLTIVIVAACIIVFVFIGILILGWLKDRNLDKGEMRRAIAGTFVIGFTVLMILCLSFNIYQKEVIIAYIELVGIVIGFYFGAKTAAEKRAEVAAKIDIENVRLPDPKKVAITVRNGGDTAITVDKIYVNEDAFEKIVKIGPQKSQEIELELPDALQPGYKIKIATTTGLTSEISK